MLKSYSLSRAQDPLKCSVFSAPAGFTEIKNSAYRIGPWMLYVSRDSVS